MTKNVQITRFHWLYLMAALLFLGACGALKKTASDTPKPSNTVISEKEKAKAERIFLDGMKAKMLGDYQEAMSLFLETVRKDPQNDAAFFELAKYHYEVGQTDYALSFAKMAADLDPENKWYVQLYGETLADKKRYKEAGKLFEDLVKKYPNDFEFYLDWAFMMVKAEDFNKAIEIYESLENNIGPNENITFQKQRLYLKMGNVDKAAAEVQGLIDANPKEPKYYILLAEMYEANDMNEKAAEVYRKLVELAPENPHAYVALANYYMDKGDRENYMKNIKIAIENPDLGIDQKIKFMFPYINFITKDSVKKEEAFQLAELLIETHPEEAKAHALYGDFLFYDDQLSEARQQYMQALQLDENRYSVWRQVMDIDWQMERFDSLLNSSDEALSLFPNQPIIYFYNGMAKLQLKQYQAAVTVMDQGIMMDPDNKILKAQLYANLGNAHHNLEDHAASDSCYEASLKLDPENVFVLNNYSYYLSLREDNLERALEMSGKANELEPQNASFQDTYGWILYQMARYDDAEEWLGKAMKTDGEKNAVILEHYGDVLFQLGKSEKAMNFWKKAKENGSASDLIDKKIADGKLYE